MENVKEKVLKFLHLDNLVGNLTGYLETRMDLYKLEIREDVAKILARALIYVAMGLFCFLFLVFFSVGMAQFINSYYQAAYVGYWIVSGVYAVAFLLFVLFRKSIDRNFEQRFMEITKRKLK